MRHGLHPAAALRHLPARRCTRSASTRRSRCTAISSWSSTSTASATTRPGSASTTRPGRELIASPEVFIAAAAERTKHIKLGTGVNSLPYHHPFILADRIVMLDHLTRGRMMFGVGPGQLTTDAMMLGIDPQQQRPRMEEAFDVIMRLFRGETVTEKTDWFTCDEAVLQMQPYSDFDIAVAASISPSGSKMAGRYGIGLLSIAATDPMGVRGARRPLEGRGTSEADEHGHTASADEVAADGPDAHRRDRRAGQGELPLRAHVGVQLPVAHHPGRRPSHSRRDFDEFVDSMNETGRGVIGTPEMAIAQIERLIEQVRWLRLLPVPRRRPRRLAGDAAPLRALRRAGDAPLHRPARAGADGYDLVMGAGTKYVDATLERPAHLDGAVPGRARGQAGLKGRRRPRSAARPLG